MATDVLRARSILMPAPQRIRAAAHRRAAGSDSHQPGATRRRSPAAGRRHPGGRRARPAAEVYAGPSFSTSPDPSLLPLPQFPARKAVAMTAVDAATRDLRLILRLE